MLKCNNRRKHAGVLSKEFSHDRFKTIFKNSPIAIILLDASGVIDTLKKDTDNKNRRAFLSPSLKSRDIFLSKLRVLEVNKSALELFAVSSSSEFILNFTSNLSKSTQRVLTEALCSLGEGMNFFEADTIIHTFQGLRSDCMLRVSVPSKFQKSLDFVILMLIDITARKEMERYLRKMAQLDGLTKLLNHFAIIERLDEELNRSKRYGIDVTCCMIDVDRFKLINDRLGHQKGDQILKRLASLIKENLRRTDIVGRYGGDEFLVILPETKSKNARIPADRIQQSFNKIIGKSLKKMPVANTLSIGISGYPSKGINTAKDLIESADQAMYKAKNMGRDRVVIE